MERTSDHGPVQCVACRASYVPRPFEVPGCPRCGCLSWVATRLPCVPPAPAAGLGAYARLM